MCALPSAIALGKKVLHSVTLLPSAALGKELSAYPFTVKASLPSVFCRALSKAFAERLCRVPEKHSAKIYTRQNENMKQNTKIIAKIFNFFSGEAATSQRPPVFIEVGAFFTLNPRLTRPVGFELTTSPSRVCCTTMSLVSRFRYLSSYIVLNRE